MEFRGKLFAIRSLPTRSIKMALGGANDADIFKESFVLRADGAVEARVAPTESVAGSPSGDRAVSSRMRKTASLEFVFRKAPARVLRVNIPHD